MKSVAIKKIFLLPALLSFSYLFLSCENKLDNETSLKFVDPQTAALVDVKKWPATSQIPLTIELKNAHILPFGSQGKLAYAGMNKKTFYFQVYDPLTNTWETLSQSTPDFFSELEKLAAGDEFKLDVVPVFAPSFSETETSFKLAFSGLVHRKSAENRKIIKQIQVFWIYFDPFNRQWSPFNHRTLVAGTNDKPIWPLLTDCPGSRYANSSYNASAFVTYDYVYAAHYAYTVGTDYLGREICGRNAAETAKLWNTNGQELEAPKNMFDKDRFPIDQSVAYGNFISFVWHQKLLTNIASGKNVYVQRPTPFLCDKVFCFVENEHRTNFGILKDSGEFETVFSSPIDPDRQRDSHTTSAAITNIATKYFFGFDKTITNGRFPPPTIRFWLVDTAYPDVKIQGPSSNEQDIKFKIVGPYGNWLYRYQIEDNQLKSLAKFDASFLK